jgi:hypothetical protein
LPFHKVFFYEFKNKNAMKKSLLFSAGIAYLTVILVSGGCTRYNGQERMKAPEKVTIYLRSVVINTEKHLMMFDTNGKFAIDSLTTGVKAGGTVYWELDKASGIKEIERIHSRKGGSIFREDAKKEFFSRRFKLEVPDGLDKGTIQKYDIDYIDQDNSPIKIDPYIRIED